MTFAQGARTRLAIGEQADFDTDAAAMAILPFNTHDLDLTKERVAGNELLGDRMPTVDRHGNRQVGGSISVDLRDTDFDLLIESALFSSFDTSGVIANGTTPKFLTIEDAALDLSTPQYRKFQGCAVNTMAISAQRNAMIAATFGVVGKNLVQGTSQLAAPSDPSGGEPFDSYSGSIFEGGTATGDAIATVTQLDFTLSNSFAPTFVLGSDVTPQLEFGRSEISGTLTSYYEDATLIDKFLNETESSLQVTFDDPASGGAYTFDFPRIKLNGAAVPVGSPQSRLITIPFIALKDASSGYQLQITKT